MFLTLGKEFVGSLTPSLPNLVKSKFRPNFQISFCEIAPFVSIGGELSFEWSYHRISSADSIVRVTLQNSIKHSQHAKKVMSNSPGLVDFSIGLVNSVLNLPDGQG